MTDRKATVANINKAIAVYMIDKEISKEQMAELLEINVNTLRMKRNGVTEWKWSEIVKLSNLLNTSIDDLAGI